MSGVLESDVLVIGGGPTGTTLGLLLARNGVRTLVIDKEADIYPLPRAAHIDHESVRVFQKLGLADAVMATSRSSSRYDFLNAKGEVLLRFEGIDRLAPGGWPASNMIHQPLVEGILRGAFANEKNVALKTSWALKEFVEADSCVRSTIETPNGPISVTSRYIVGADGARSPVSNAAGIDFEDLQFDEPWLVIDMIVHDASRLPQVNLQICDPMRPTTCVLMGSGRHRWEFMIKPGETAEQVLEDGFIAKLMTPWNVADAVTLERKVVYRFNAKVARQWRKGPVLLAGDAAHQMPPFAGQGLCSGLRDAANIAWKLGAIIRGGTSDLLLDSYQIEREPHVRAIIGMAMMMGRTVCITDPEAAAQRDTQMLAARATGESFDGAVSFPPMDDGCILKGITGAGAYFAQAIGGEPVRRLDDVLGPGAWLISRSTHSVQHRAGVHLLEITIEDASLVPFRDHLEAWLSRHDAEAVLVRPDCYVFGTGSAQMLYDAWAARLA